MNLRTSVALCVLSILATSVARADEPNYGSSTLSPAEIKALLDERSADVDREAMVEMYLDCCGIDLKNKTAKVTNQMLGQRNNQMQEMFEHHKDYSMWSGYHSFLTLCKTTPKVLVDVSVVIDNQTNGLPTDQVFQSFANACGNPPNPILTKFIQKFKTIHFALLPDMSKRPAQGYVYKFDEKSGELTVFVFNQGASNITEKTTEWMQKQ